MNVKNIFRNIRGLAFTALLLIPAAGFVSCNDDDTDNGSPYFRLEKPVAKSKLVTASSELGFEAAAVIADPTLELMSYEIRSNCDWSVECNSTDAEWLHFYPQTGRGDGKIRFCLDDNTATATRSATVVFRYANGSQTQTTLVVAQEANVPYIKFIINNIESSEIKAGRNAAHYSIELLSNVTPFYVPEPADWATFTETGNGTFTLDIADFPNEPTALSRSFNIAFRGSGEHKEIKANLNVLQDITPKITITSDDIDGDDEDSERSLPAFPAYQPNAFSFKVASNWDWTISVPANAWFTVSPSAGEAGKEYTMTVNVNSNLSLDERTSSFSIISDEVLGTRDTKVMLLSQESLAESGPLEGLDAPVKWFFNGAAGTDYTAQKEQFEVNNKLLAASGVGYLSYFHMFTNPDGTQHPNSTRMIGGTGQPYVTGAWKDDYWLFEVPVKNFKSGTKVRFTGLTRISGTGQKFWSLEYLDGTSWKPAKELQTTTVGGEQVSYTHQVPTANMVIDETMSFTRGISEGSVQIRFRCVANTTGGTEPNGGTMRWASSADNGFNDSPVIQVVE